MGRNWIVLPAAILAAKSSSILALATAGEHLVDVQRVDLARESGSRRRFGSGPFREQDHHCRCVGWVVRGESDSRRRGAKSCVKPKLVDLGGVVWQ